MMAALSHTNIAFVSQTNLKALTALEICKTNFGEDLLFRSLERGLSGSHIDFCESLEQCLLSRARGQVLEGNAQSVCLIYATCARHLWLGGRVLLSSGYLLLLLLHYTRF